MNSMGLLSVVFLISFSVCAASATDKAQFKSGTIFSAIPLEGEVTVLCNSLDGGLQTAIFVCRDNVLLPSAFDYFVGPVFKKAEILQISATKGDGNIRKKEVDYEGDKGITEEKLNLWISTLFQKPLLVVGDNKINWTLLSEEKKVLAQGEFVATVKKEPARSCPKTTYTSSDSGDCRSPYSICQKYFEQLNYCK